MNTVILTPEKALNKALLRVRPTREHVDNFKVNLLELLNHSNEIESEEFHKNLVSDFLKKTYYSPDHFVNTKGRNDLVIHRGPNAHSPVGVILEAKRPTNKTEMVTKENLNKKAFHELILYFLRERITARNLEVKHLIITNIYEWFVFDAEVFDDAFARDKEVVRLFSDFEGGRLGSTKTDFFYKEIAEPALVNLQNQINFTYFDIRNYQQLLDTEPSANENRLLGLFKILSAEHLLKLPFANDNNRLDQSFYQELLHIIGLEETKKKGKKVIERLQEGRRQDGTLLENTIIQLDSLDKVDRVPGDSKFGGDYSERLFDIGLQLAITWIDRVIFLKLLEAQLVAYHKGDKSYAFLNSDKVKSFDDLNSLFFAVLARERQDRIAAVRPLFDTVPYLNSSLFEVSEIEDCSIVISNLSDSFEIDYLTTTVVRDRSGDRRSGRTNTLEYLFQFLDAYDFGSEGTGDVQEGNKTLINASVLGLIFEKINGYKEGAFFTPGFVTMYMCREVVRKAVIQKFNNSKGWECKTIDELYCKIGDKVEANQIVNSLTICDPAVGSGHFLVSALNEIISVKGDLKILMDRDGKTFRDYVFEVVNDELIITDDNGDFFEYRYKNSESQRVQEALFHEKQTIIENCLFGVDINPNSVRICRLRLWIELLKNAYYRSDDVLETLPNIDINIKRGNSLIRRFPLSVDLKSALKKNKWKIKDYKSAVHKYRLAKSKADKREMERLISDIKTGFRSEINSNDPLLRRLRKLSSDLAFLRNQGDLFPSTAEQRAKREEKEAKLVAQIEVLGTQIEEIKSNKIYEDAFEWRFEFPEVLDKDGAYAGFDCIIGNPPYIRVQDIEHKHIDYYKSEYEVAHKRIDISLMFFELGLSLQNELGHLCFISSIQFVNAEYGRNLRKLLLLHKIEKFIDFDGGSVFEDVTTYPGILLMTKGGPSNFEYTKITHVSNDCLETLGRSYKSEQYEIEISHLDDDLWVLVNSATRSILEKIQSDAIRLSEFSNPCTGLTTGADGIFILDEETARKLELEEEVILPVIRGKNIVRWGVKGPFDYVIYPYEMTNGGTEIIDEVRFRSKFPNAYAYLEKHRTRLAKRKDSRKMIDGADGWYKLVRKGRLDLFQSIKILTPGMSKTNRFALDIEGRTYLCGGAGVFGMVQNRFDNHFLLGILNSKVIQCFLQCIATKKQHGYFSYLNSFLEQIPFKRATDEEQEAISDLVARILDSTPGEVKREHVFELEQEIDKLVYQIYGLSTDQIRIIEERVRH